MKAYKGSFIKKDGSERKMIFCRICDIPQEFLNSKLSGGNAKILPENMELVYDLEADNFRTFNHATMIGELEEFEVDFVFETEDAVYVSLTDKIADKIADNILECQEIPGVDFNELAKSSIWDSFVRRHIG